MNDCTRPLILASASPRRRRLLAQLGIPFRTVESDLEEARYRDPEPIVLVQRLALEKANDVARRLESGVVVGSDTVVVLEEAVLGKPADVEEARRMLESLRGRVHRVLTGVAAVDVESGFQCSIMVTTQVQMSRFSEAMLEAYVQSGKPLDKAGAYGIQDLEGQLVVRIQGCYNNVVGLPLCEVAGMLRAQGFRIEAPSPECALPSGEPCPRLADREGPVQQAVERDEL